MIIESTSFDRYRLTSISITLVIITCMHLCKCTGEAVIGGRNIAALTALLKALPLDAAGAVQQHGWRRMVILTDNRDAGHVAHRTTAVVAGVFEAFVVLVSNGGASAATRASAYGALCNLLQTPANQEKAGASGVRMQRHRGRPVLAGARHY